jgi:nicotinamidase/pyrazinamidase
MDAAEMGFKTHLVEDACRGVNLRPGDVKDAIEEMERGGIRVVQSAELLRAE